MKMDLFGPVPKRRPPRVIMHVTDFGMFPDGKDAGKFLCRKCGYDTDWIYATIAEARRGIPCPQCNGEG